MTGIPTARGEPMADAPELKRGLFGYRKDAVRSLLADRERMFLEVSEEAASAEQRAETTRGELDQAMADVGSLRQELDARTGELGSAQRRVEQLETDLAAVTSQVAEQSQRARDAELRLKSRESSLLERISALETELQEERAALPAGVNELTRVLDATRDAVDRIMAGARRSAEDQLAEVRRTREELQVEIERASDWREQVLPLVEGVRHEIGRAQAQVVQVGARISEALRPMTDSLSTLGYNLEGLERAATAQTPEGSPPERVDLVSHERAEGEEQADRGQEQPSPAVPQAAHETQA